MSQIGDVCFILRICLTSLQQLPRDHLVSMNILLWLPGLRPEFSDMKFVTFSKENPLLDKVMSCNQYTHWSAPASSYV